MQSSPEHAARDALRFNLVFRRAKLRLSQAALAERAGVSRPLVSDIEQSKANVTLDVINRLALALETTASDLIAPVQRGSSDEDVAHRLNDGPESFVDAREFVRALDESDADPAVGTTERYSNRGRKAAV